MPFHATPPRRRPQRLLLGSQPFELLPDGRVFVTLPPTDLPLGTTLQASAVYPDLRAFLATALPHAGRGPSTR